MYIRIDEWQVKIAKEKKLNANELIIFAYLYSFMSNGNKCYPSYEAISENTNCSRRTVIRCISKLSELKLINTDKKDGKSNIYTSDILTPHQCQIDTTTSDKMSPHQCQIVTTTSDKMTPNNTIYKNNYNKNIYSDKMSPPKKGFKDYSNKLTDEDIDRIVSQIDKYNLNF